MDPNVIREYLVGLGFTIDQPQYAKFANALSSSHKLVEAHTSGILSQYLKWQGAVTGIFTTLTGAVIGYMDKTAMAEQENRLFAQRMFMTEAQAKRTRMALDALGQPLEAIAWDPELHGRFTQLIHDQERLQQMLGPDYLQQMHMVRDMRFELTRMEVVAQYIGMKMLSDIFKGLGLGDGNVLTFLQGKVEWLMQHGPELAQRLADTIVPVLKETYRIGKDLGEVIGLAFNVFTNLIGILTGDRSLEGTNLTFEKMAGAVEHVVGWLAIFLEKIIDAEKLTLHLITAVELAVQGNRKGAMAELGQAMSGLNAGSGFVIGSVAGSAIGGAMGIGGGPIGILGGMTGGALMGGGVGAIAGLLNPNSAPSRVPGGVALSPAGADLAAAARAFGLDPNLLAAVAHQESGGKQTDANGRIITSGAGALGIMQLMPDTARRYGVNPYDAQQNATGGAHFLSDLLRKYGGDTAAALAAYNEGETAYDRNMRTGHALPAETRNYVDAIMAQYNRSSRGGGYGGGGGGVHIDKIETHIMQPNATPAQIQDATTAAIDQRLGKLTQRDLAELGGVYTY